MFDSLKHWFDSLAEDSKLFEHPDDEALHSALASVLYHIISADKQVDKREVHLFEKIMKQEFDLLNDQINHLYQAASQSTADWHNDLHTINHFLKNKPLVRLDFMKKLIQLVDVDGIQENELEAFYETLHEVFPEIKQP